MERVKRRYTHLPADAIPIMERLHREYGFTYAQIADLYNCSRSRVVQLVTQYRDED